MGLFYASWLIAGREMRALARDRAALLLAFLLPAALILVFGAAIGAFTGGGGIAPPRLLLVDLDGSAFSGRLAERLRASKSVRLVEQRRGAAWSVEEAREAVASGKAPAALVIPQGAGERVEQGQLPGLELKRDAGQEIVGPLLAFALAEALFEAAGPRLWQSIALKGMQEMGFPAAGLPLARAALASLDRRLQEIAEEQMVEGGAAFQPEGTSLGKGSAAALGFIGVSEELLGGGRAAEEELARQARVAHAVAGIAVMMLLFGVASLGGGLLRERDTGTLARLLASPIPGEAVLLGKFLAAMALGSTQLLVLLALGSIVFSVPLLRDPVQVAVMVLCTCAAASGFGLLLGTLCRSRTQLDALATLLILVMSCLGGSWVPRVFMPEIVRTIGYVTLNAWAMDGFEKIFWHRLPFPAVLPQAGVLVLIAALAGAISVLGFRARFVGGLRPQKGASSSCGSRSSR